MIHGNFRLIIYNFAMVHELARNLLSKAFTDLEIKHYGTYRIEGDGYGETGRNTKTWQGTVRIILAGDPHVESPSALRLRSRLRPNPCARLHRGLPRPTMLDTGVHQPTPETIPNYEDVQQADLTLELLVNRSPFLLFYHNSFW